MAKKSKYRNIPLFPKTKEKLGEVRHVLEGSSQKKHLSWNDAVEELIKFYRDANPTKFKKGKSSLENIKVGDIIPDKDNKDVEITDTLIEQMRMYEQETKKSAIYRNKITGLFLHFKWKKEQKSK